MDKIHSNCGPLREGRSAREGGSASRSSNRWSCAFLSILCANARSKCCGSQSRASRWYRQSFPRVLRRGGVTQLRSAANASSPLRPSKMVAQEFFEEREALSVVKRSASVRDGMHRCKFHFGSRFFVSAEQFMRRAFITKI